MTHSIPHGIRRQQGGQVRENNSKPDWFPLSVHLEKPATFEHWARCIVLRLGIANAPQDNGWNATRYRSVVIADNGTDWKTDAREKYMGVKCLTAFDAFALADAFDVPANTAIRTLAERQSKGDYDFSVEACELKSSWGAPDSERFNAAFEYRLPVMVNIALDDATLKEHFQIWLAVMRAQVNQEAGPTRLHKIDQDFLEKCHALRVLAAFDLLTWRDLTGATYTDAAIASWLWPDSGPLSDGTYVDRAERLRKVTKPLTKDFMTWPTVERIEQRQAEVNLLREAQSTCADTPEREPQIYIPAQEQAA
jgi:hypothetical protein